RCAAHRATACRGRRLWCGPSRSPRGLFWPWSHISLGCGDGCYCRASARRPLSSLAFANGSSVGRLVQGAARGNTPAHVFWCDATRGLLFLSFSFFVPFRSLCSLLFLLSSFSIFHFFSLPLALRTHPDRGVGGAPGSGILSTSRS